jgi:predicted nucleic acid-binding protein
LIAVFDTNVVIDALNGLAEAKAEFARYERVAISRVTWMEVLVGTKDDDKNVREYLEAKFDIVALSLELAEKTIELRRLHRMRLPDAVIWATAKTRNAVLVTRNTKDFKAEWDGIRIPYIVDKLKETPER